MQAARGASLTPSDQTAESGRRRPPGRRPGPGRASVWRLFAVVAVLGLAFDQATKAWAVAALEDGDRPLLGDWFTLHLTFNPGAAFSTGTEYTIVFTGLAMAAVVVVTYLSRRLGSRLWAVGLGLLLAGVAGNLADRLFRDPEPLHGHVVDFLRLPNWPVFNFADVFINVAAGVIILQSLRGVGLDGTKEGSEAETDPGEDGVPPTDEATR